MCISGFLHKNSSSRSNSSRSRGSAGVLGKRRKRKKIRKQNRQSKSTSLVFRRERETAKLEPENQDKKFYYPQVFISNFENKKENMQNDKVMNESDDSVDLNNDSNRKKMIVFESKRAKDRPIMFLDMRKIRNNLHHKLNNVCERLKQEAKLEQKTKKIKNDRNDDGHHEAIDEDVEQKKKINSPQTIELTMSKLKLEQQQQQQQKLHSGIENTESKPAGISSVAPDRTVNEQAKSSVRTKTKKDRVEADKDKNDADAADRAKMIREFIDETYCASLRERGYEMRLRDTGDNGASSLIGEGGYGRVYRVTKQSRTYACKIISNISFTSKFNSAFDAAPDAAAAAARPAVAAVVPLNTTKLRVRFANEVEIMKRLAAHPNIVRFAESFTDRVKKSIVDSDDSAAAAASASAADGDDGNNNNSHNTRFPSVKIDEAEEAKDNGDYPRRHLALREDLDPPRETNNTAVSGGGDDDNQHISFTTFFLVMEFANSKTLSFYVKNRRALSEPVTKGIFRQLIDAVRYMHGARIAHRDIKLSNVLLHSAKNDYATTSTTTLMRPSSGHRGSSNRKLKNTFNFDVKLCDFGLSSLIGSDRVAEKSADDHQDHHHSHQPQQHNDENGDDDDEYDRMHQAHHDHRAPNLRRMFTKPAGTAFYMSPEILRSYYFYSRKQPDRIAPYCAYKGDVWSLGVCMYYCLHGSYPLDIFAQKSANRHERIYDLEKIFGSAPWPTHSLDEREAEKTMFELYSNRFRNSMRNISFKLNFNCQELLRRMLEIDARKRADIVEASRHVYLR